MTDRTANTPEPADETRLVLTVDEAARRLGIGRTTMFALVSSGEVRSVLIGRRMRRIPAQALKEYIDRLLNAA
ncbi:excisionase family DNA-binding protein [Streptomyces sp. 7N604]|uniref:excisionase family DNA-binding protein n=1 Tax=Streptomyces sp. 7N604 TaxID=3457415 RepID=UPI003FD53B39